MRGHPLWLRSNVWTTPEAKTCCQGAEPWRERTTWLRLSPHCRFLREDLGRTTPQDERSNIFAAIEAALAHEDLDRIVVISSSSLYAGEHESVPLMVKLLEERTRFRPAIFDFVLLGATEPGPGR
ncbi:MAG: hypothetical protein ACI8WY_003051 [Planctomycetota bacterium]|jgi:hypothetical protein